MSGKTTTLFALCVLLVFLSTPPVAKAQLDSLTSTVNLSAVVSETLTVLASPSVVNFTLVANSTASGSTPISITTTWALGQTRTSVSLYAYFSNPSSALTEPLGIDIPSANVRGSVNSGAFTSFTGVSPFSTGGSITVFTESIGVTNVAKTRTDTLALQVNTSGLTLASGIYTGVLVFQAQAI